MGEGQPWLTAGCSTGPLVTILPTLCLLALSAAPSHSATIPTTLPTTTQLPLCPAPCHCSWLSNTTTTTTTTTHVEVVCAQAGLTNLPAASLPASLELLDLQGNHLAQLANLSALRQLRYLDISNNSLTLLERGIFHNLTKLSILVLSSNAIELLEDGVFEGLAAVSALDLGYNRITSLSGDMLVGLDNVRVLNLKGNFISEMSNQTFLYLHRLKVLDLSHNHLQYLPTDAFLGLESVQTILLQNNYLTSIMGAFNGLPQLSALDLSYNMLAVLENNTFTNLQRMDRLHLSFNNISNISPAFFTEGAVLEWLDLQGNSLEQLPGGLFDHFPSLQALDLSQMPYLQSISVDAFRSVISLTSLNLSCNPRLSFLHPQLMAHLPKLTVVDLRSNNLSVLSHITFHSNPLLRHLYLAHNPFQCGCGVAWMLLPAKHGTDQSVVTDLGSVQCQLQSNGSFTPVSQVSQETLQCNNMSSVNMTPTVYAKIASQVVLSCDYVAEEASVVTWTTPRGLVFHYHPNNPEANSHLVKAYSAGNDTDKGEFHKHHRWHSQGYDSDLQYHPDHIVLQDDGSLLINFVLRSDAGPYRCTVHNSKHGVSATTTLLLDYTVLFEVKIMSIIVGLGCAAASLTLNTVNVIIMWGARKLVNKRRRERIHKLLESLDEYRTTQITRIRTNYSYQLSRIREHYHTQSLRLKENYTIQMKRVRQGCSNQVERIRDNYHARLNHLKEYSSHQIQQIRDATNHQIIRIRDYGSLQMERLRETYKLQQQHVLKVIEAMNLENCRTVVETECMRTESMIFDINLPDLDEDNTSTEEASSQQSQPDSVYATAHNSHHSSQDSLATIMEAQTQEYPITEANTIIVLPSDPPDDESLQLSPSDSSSFSALCDNEELDSLHVISGEDSEKETIV